MNVWPQTDTDREQRSFGARLARQMELTVAAIRRAAEARDAAAATAGAIESALDAWRAERVRAARRLALAEAHVRGASAALSAWRAERERAEQLLADARADRDALIRLGDDGGRSD